MTKLERVFQELGQLYEFNKAIRPYRIPRKPKKHAEAEKEPTTPAVPMQKVETK